MTNEVPRSPISNTSNDPKLSQFLEELNELLERYQYNVVAQLSVTPKGIVPTLSIANRIPPKKPVVEKVTNKKKGKKINGN